MSDLSSPSPFFRRSFSIALAIFLGFGSLLLLALIVRPLAVVILAISIAAALYPIVQRFENRFPRNAVIITIYLTLLLIVLGIAALLIPPLIQQTEEVVNKLPDYLNQARQWLQRREFTPDTDTITSGIGESAGSLLTLPITLFSGFTEFILMIILSMYFLFEAENIRRFALSLFPTNTASQIENIAAEVLRSVGGFVRGLLINMMLVGIVTTIGLTLIGVNFALVLGITAALLEVIPIVGPIVASIPMILIALLDSPAKALAVAVFILVLQQFEGNFLIPAVMHRETKLSPLVILIAVTIGGALGGILGVLVSIPLAATLTVLMRRVFVPVIQRQTGAQS